MEERAAELGGLCRVIAREGAGTLVSAVLPTSVGADAVREGVPA
jgi:nitrate/nitrite-specific signal transduction histidine kinase